MQLLVKSFQRLERSLNIAWCSLAFSVLLILQVTGPSSAQEGTWCPITSINPDCSLATFEGDSTGAGFGAALFSKHYLHPFAPGGPCKATVNSATCYAVKAKPDCTPGGISDWSCHGGAGLTCNAGSSRSLESKCILPDGGASGCEGCCTGFGGGGAGFSDSGAGQGDQTNNPVEILTGRKLGTYVDWSTGGKNELSFVRYYSSKTNLIGAPSWSFLGMNWRSNFDARVRYDFTGTPVQAATGKVLHIAFPNGTELAFRKTAVATWLPAAPTFAAGLVPTFNTLRTDLNVNLTEGANTITVQMPGNTKYVFDFSGKLLRKEHIDGYFQRLEYSGTNLERVVDSLGRTMSFTYQSEDRTQQRLMTSVKLPDGNVIKFAYTQRIVLPAGVTLPGPWIDTSGEVDALSSVTYPDLNSCYRQ